MFWTILLGIAPHAHQELAKNQGEGYEYWTRRKFVIENILLERQAYFPEKITDKLLGFGLLMNHVVTTIKKYIKMNV